MCPKGKVEAHFEKGVKCSLKKELREVSGCGQREVRGDLELGISHGGVDRALCREWVGGARGEALGPMKWREGGQDIAGQRHQIKFPFSKMIQIFIRGRRKLQIRGIERSCENHGNLELNLFPPK